MRTTYTYDCDDCHVRNVPAPDARTWNIIIEGVNIAGVRRKLYASRRTAHLCKKCATKRLATLDASRKQGEKAA